MNPLPVVYQCDYVAKRSRLTTFFRVLLVIPHYILLLVLGVISEIAVVIAWFALLFTGRYPQGLYDFVAGTLRFTTRVSAYVYLVADPYPPFGLDEHPEYPACLVLAPPKASYSRVKVFFRIILLIPVIIISYALALVTELGALFAWFVIVITGSQPEGLQNMINLGLGYRMRASAYAFLLTEDFPSFSNEGTDVAVQS